MFKFKSKQLINYFTNLNTIYSKNTRSSQYNNYFVPRYKSFNFRDQLNIKE